jgi:RNA polymerase sigma factor (sigma-70 family)
MRRFGPQVYRFIILRTRQEADARDALQETFLAVWQELPRLKDPARFWPWVVGIAAHKSTDVIRQRMRAREAPPDENLRVTDSVGSSDFEIALGQLPPDLSSVLLLRYLLGFSEQETARLLGIRVGTVKSRAARAKERLRRMLLTTEKGPQEHDTEEESDV